MQPPPFFNMPKDKASGRKSKSRVEKKKKGDNQHSTFCGPILTCLHLDPNAPKRGLSAYMFFANEQRENVREENPGISFGRLPDSEGIYLSFTYLTSLQVRLARSSVRDGRR